MSGTGTAEDPAADASSAETPGTGTVPRGELVDYLAELLSIARGGDYCPNGLQVEGTPEIARLVTGVSACQALFEQAIDWRADAILVHHGLFWHGQPSVLTGPMAKRVKLLMQSDVNLLAYHLPLDRHPLLGNNALAAEAFGLRDLQPFGDAKGLPVGFHGRFETPMLATALSDRCTRIYAQKPLIFDAGPDLIHSMGIISGAAQRELYTAIDLGLDAFVTGEVSEWVMNAAHEHRIHYVAAGHYATERLGVRSLGDHLAARYGIEVTFVDVPNPV